MLLRRDSAILKSDQEVRLFFELQPNLHFQAMLILNAVAINYLTVHNQKNMVLRQAQHLYTIKDLMINS